jgi:hypothetical protein
MVIVSHNKGSISNSVILTDTCVEMLVLSLILSGFAVGAR